MIGIDIQDVARLKSFVESDDRMRRMFTQLELDYISQKSYALETVAGIFCAKEAFFKAVGSGINISQLHDVQVGHLHNGMPHYVLSPEIIKQHNLSASQIDLSISHTKTTAVAVCHIARRV